MARATTYDCPQCNAPLKLDPDSGKLSCAYCEGSFTVDEIESLLAKTDPARKEDAPQETPNEDPKADVVGKRAKKTSSKKKGKPQYSYTPPEGLHTRTLEEWEAIVRAGGDQFQDVVGYTCTNCGAQVVTDSVTVATSCQYCGSSVVVDNRLSGGLKPDYVIPFKVKAQDIPALLTKFYEKRPLLPKDFFYKNQVGEVQGLYVPFWLYHGTVEGNATYTSSISHTYRSGGDDVTEVTHYQSERVGHVTYSYVPVDASKRIDNDLMDALEPFNYAEMKPFKPGYLTGFVAERFDQSPRDEFDRIGCRMMDTARSQFLTTVPGGGAAPARADFYFRDPAANYVFLPVYLFNCKYYGKLYRYAVNGQTGEIVGEVPTGKREGFLAWVKQFLKYGLVAAAVMVAICIIGID